MERCSAGKICFIVCMLACGVSASEIAGRITLQRKLSGRTVAPAVYDLRGATVPPGQAAAAASSAFGRVAVWLEPETPVTVSPRLAKMEQSGRRFQPDFIIVPVGSTVAFPNLDPIFHNIFSLSRAQTFDLGYYSQGKSRSVTFKHPGVVQVYCHVHPNMYGVVVVSSSPWFTKPASDGTFDWMGVPVGEYRLLVWQKAAGLVHRKVSVPAAGTVHVEISLPDDADE